MRAFLGTCLSRGLSRVIPEIESRLRGETGRRVLLTIDDGPTDAGTPELLDALARHGVGAIFFLVGDNAKIFPGRVREICDAGHAIGNHTQTHIDAWRAPWRRVVAELARCEAVLSELSGRDARTVRPPFGRITRPLVRWCRRRERRLMLWDVMPPDFELGRTPADIAASMERGVRPGSIVCLHDNAKSRGVTAKVLDLCLPRMKAAGWEFIRPAA